MRALAALVLMCLALAAPARAGGGVAACIDNILSPAEEKGFAGAVLASEGDEVLFQKGYGTTEPGGAGEPVTSETVFLIGSIVKDFTRLAAFNLVHEGRLTLDQTLPEFFDGVPEDKAGITVRQLLDHTSGIPDLIGKGGVVLEGYEVNYDYIPVTRGEMVEKTLAAPLLFAPGERREYSNSGFALLAAIIEIASGQPFEAYVFETVLKPADMLSTGYRIPDWSRHTLAHGVIEGEDWGTALDEGRWMADGPSWNLRGNGGMLGTVSDLHRFVRALAGNGAYPEEVVAALLGDMRVSENWNSRIYAGAGSNGIFNSVFVWMPDQDRALIMISSNAAHNAELDYLRPVLPCVFTRAEGAPK